METITRSGYQAAVADIGGGEKQIPGDSGAGNKGHHGAEEPHHWDYGDGRRQEFVVHVAGSMFNRCDGGSGAVDFIAGGFEEKVP